MMPVVMCAHQVFNTWVLDPQSDTEMKKAQFSAENWESNN